MKFTWSNDWSKEKDIINNESLGDNKGFFDKIGQGIESFWNNLTGQTSKEIAEKNFNLQQEQFDYQKLLNNQMMEREDTAYQRAVKDAQLAGLSGLSITSGSPANTGTSANAPQINDYASNDFSRGLNLLNTITQFQNNINQQVLSKKRAEADIMKTNAETEDIKAKTDLFLYQLSGNKKLFDKDFNDKMRNYEFNEKYGIFNGSDPYQKYAKLNNLTKQQYSDIVQSNQFNQLGLLVGVLQKIGDKITNGKINSIDDAVDKASEVLNDITVNNNELNVSHPNITNDTTPTPTNPLSYYQSNKQLIDQLKNKGTNVNNGVSNKSGKIKSKKKRSGQQE